jgi:hypothetical protein
LLCSVSKSNKHQETVPFFVSGKVNKAVSKKVSPPNCAPPKGQQRPDAVSRTVQNTDLRGPQKQEAERPKGGRTGERSALRTRFDSRRTELKWRGQNEFQSPETVLKRATLSKAQRQFSSFPERGRLSSTETFSLVALESTAVKGSASVPFRSVQLARHSRRTLPRRKGNPRRSERFGSQFPAKGRWKIAF